MVRVRQSFHALILLTFLLGTLAWGREKAAAQSPVRQTTVQIGYTEYVWWLMSWEDNSLVCQVVIDHEGLPTHNEIYNQCGQVNYDWWANTPPCKTLTDPDVPLSECVGIYLHLVSSGPKQKDVVIDLPPPSVWVNLEGCTPTPPENLCPEIPTLLLTGEEPVPNERILTIEGTYDGQAFYCESDVCRLPLRPTSALGTTIEFWANSSYGDSSEHYIAHVRVMDTGVSEAPGGSGWYVDVISSQWQGAPLATCSRIWEAFPPVGGPPVWLSSPDQSALLASEDAYYYLAGRLISQGLVKTADCPTGGLLPNGYADACGLERARPIVDAWQNLFDGRIIQVAQETGIPAQLLKNLFAQESQFWPGIFRVPFEYGLGQITENGTDAVLLWDNAFFDQFCPLVLSEEGCAGGYLHLDKESQAILRGALALQARSDCPNCMTGVDLTNVHFSISLFANTMQANCSQVRQTIVTATERTPGEVATYEDLWRFTIANYHAGPGCMAYAITSAWQSGATLTWDQVAMHLTEPCKGVIPYVDKITQ